MAIHNKDTFIRPYSSGDRYIFIQDINKVTTFEIDPHSVTATFHRTNYFYCKIEGSDNPNQIEFSSSAEALEALTIFQIALDIAQATVGIYDTDDTFVGEIYSEGVSFGGVVGTGSHTIDLDGTIVWTLEHSLGKKGNVVITNENEEEIELYIKHDAQIIEIKSNVPTFQAGGTQVNWSVYIS